MYENFYIIHSTQLLENGELSICKEKKDRNESI